MPTPTEYTFLDGLLQGPQGPQGAAGASGGSVVGSYFSDAVGSGDTLDQDLYTVPSGGEGWYRVSLMLAPKEAISDGSPLTIGAKVVTDTVQSGEYHVVEITFYMGSEVGPASIYQVFASFSGQFPAGSQDLYLREGDMVNLFSSAGAGNPDFTVAARLELVALRSALGG